MKNITTVLFDLDGTLLPMNAEAFERAYLTSLGAYTKEVIDPKAMLGSLYEGQKAMITSLDSSKTNEEVFYEKFESLVGTETKNTLASLLDDYYLNDYDVSKEATAYSQEMVDAVSHLKEKGYRVILATNPQLPKIATDKRIRWAGFEPHDFADITRFEKNHFCKPNLEYYKEIFADNQISPEECLMIGNDVEEDLIVKELGMKAWLIEDDLIHRGSDIECDWRGNRIEFLEKIKEVF